MSGQRQPLWAEGTEIVARYTFGGKTQDDLPFHKDEVLIVERSTRDHNWYRARNKNGASGLIPVNYFHVKGAVKLETMPWFHGKISREDAERLLYPREEGLFLVRESVNFPGDYSLSVVHGDKVEHYRVIYEDNKLTVDNEEYFENLTLLVKHYEQDSDGLCTRLATPLKKKGGLDVSVNSEQFVREGWAIKRRDLHLGAIIGKGEFGDVLEGHYRGQKVAVKSLKDTARAAQKFLTEASVMTSLNHKNLVRLLGVSLDGDPIYIITEFCGKGSLVEYLRTRGRAVIGQKDLVGFSKDVACGMEYLESKNLVHRDLAARNVLISDDATAKVSDFGLAREASFNMEGRKFPIKWTAPEALKEGNFSTKSDVWSYGVLLWELYSFGRVPYPRVPIEQVTSRILAGYRMECPEGCPPNVYAIMKECWDIKPNKRPTFGEMQRRLAKILSEFL